MNASAFDRDNERRQRQLETLDRLAQRFGTSMQDAFARGADGGRRLDTVLTTLGTALAKASLKVAMKPLKRALESLLKGGSISDDAAEAATPLVRGGVLSRGLVMPFAQGGVVAAPTYFPLGRGLGLMGEQGAEAVMPLARGPDGRLGVRTGGNDRPVAVTVNIATPDADSFRRSEAQVSAALARAVARGRRGL